MSDKKKELPEDMPEGGVYADDDFHLREEVVTTNFTGSDDDIHEKGLAWITGQLQAGRTWNWINKEFKLADRELRDIILDDFLKINLAQRHFQGGEPVKQLAKHLKVPVKALQQAKTEMIEEVKKASIDAYHLTQERQEAAEAAEKAANAKRHH